MERISLRVSADLAIRLAMPCLPVYHPFHSQSVVVFFNATTENTRPRQRHQTALEEIESLWDADDGTPEADRLALLVMNVEAYEAKHHPIPPPDPIEMILHVMDARGLTRRDLKPYLGARARVSEILNRRRPLSLAMIRRLQAGLGIPAEILIQPYELQKAGEQMVDEALISPLP